ncbi:thiamine phosphate synthase [Phenylobacterium deserti]|uniref:thiamine phosphate synthase n=1 Tax=Phenylobacterium deserti TaxID=1914756 RepID=UPI001F0CC54A|nr:thiamine phosphate synthase [Phenylobacterium deserti]
MPRLLLFTDPVRTPDPLAAADTLPSGAGVVFRAFGDPDALNVARRLRELASARGLVLLIGADHRLAWDVGADGVHLPERLARRARALKSGRPGWIVTTAAHSEWAAHLAGGWGADAAVVSAVFPSRSPSAGAPIGPVRLAAMARRVRLPIYALGGVNSKTARRLKDAGLAGVAAVDGLRT